MNCKPYGNPLAHQPIEWRMADALASDRHSVFSQHSVCYFFFLLLFAEILLWKAESFYGIFVNVRTKWIRREDKWRHSKTCGNSSSNSKWTSEFISLPSTLKHFGMLTGIKQSTPPMILNWERERKKPHTRSFHLHRLHTNADTAFCYLISFLIFDGKSIRWFVHFILNTMKTYEYFVFFTDMLVLEWLFFHLLSVIYSIYNLNSIYSRKRKEKDRRQQTNLSLQSRISTHKDRNCRQLKVRAICVWVVVLKRTSICTHHLPYVSVYTVHFIAK